MSFEIGDGVNSSRVFIVRKQEMAGRWDPFYYRPELVELERQVQAVSSESLRDFVHRMAGGATPSTREAEQHYTDDDDGVPFIRVQNLSTTGRLNLHDIKRVTRATHETLLRRSRLSGGELLVKITGVGRMAVASVVPPDFEGNINQHMVAIHTGGIHISKTLAAYLNLDISEKLASRRSTGGTRPALDYPALLSIPVVYDERIPILMNEAVERYEKDCAKAKALLGTIDAVLLDELELPVPAAQPYALSDRIFTRSLAEISGGRFDPIAHHKNRRELERSIRGGPLPVEPLRTLVDMRKQITSQISTEDDYVGLENIDGDTGDYIATEDKESVSSALRFRAGQVLFPKLRPYLNKTHFARFDGLCSTEFHIFTSEEVDAEYLCEILRSRMILGITSMLMTGNTLPRLQMSDIERLPIPVPPRDVQGRIASKIGLIKQKARALRHKAAADLDAAKQHIESLILGQGTAS